MSSYCIYCLYPHGLHSLLDLEIKLPSIYLYHAKFGKVGIKFGWSLVIFLTISLAILNKLFACWGDFFSPLLTSKLTFCKSSLGNTIRVSNGLDSDPAPSSVWSGSSLFAILTSILWAQHLIWEEKEKRVRKGLLHCMGN